MIHPHTTTAFISDEKGNGVVATKFIPKGTITWVQDKLDRVLDKKEVAKLGENYAETIDTYAFRNKLGQFVLCWDHGKYVNHSFKSNCITTPYDFEIAIRDIHPGEELTDDYGYLNISQAFEAMDEGTERKIVYPDDLLRFHEVWDKQIADALKYLNDVEQPMYRMLDNDLKKHLVNILDGKAELESIITCYYDENKKTTIKKLA